MGLQTAVLVIVVVVLCSDAIGGGTDDTGRALTEAATVLALAVCGGLLALGLWRQRSVTKTPSLMWNGLGVLTGFSLARNGAPLLGSAVMVLTVVGFLAALGVPRYDPDED